MKGQLYVIRDTVSLTVTPPFYSPNDNVAVRDFLFGCFGSSTPPSTCQLLKIAEFESNEDPDSTLPEFKLVVSELPCPVYISDFDTERWLKEWQLLGNRIDKLQE